MGQAVDVIPYCGAPPSPAELWSRWNLDPVLIAVLAAMAAAYWFGLRRRPAAAAWRPAAFAGGWLILSLALISPLCPLSVSLFSARVGQHMVLTLVAAPLIVSGRPWTVLGLPAIAGAWKPGQAAAGAALAFTIAVWFWHSPGPYDATFASGIAYWTMHVTVIGAALLVWSVLLDAPRERAVPVLAAGAFSTLQMTFLGALITLSPHALYAPHAVTPLAWGLTQQSDQQLGGLIMWVPGCTVFLAVTLWTLVRLLADPPRPAIAAPGKLA